MQKYMNRLNNEIKVEAARLTPTNVDELANWTQSQIVEEIDMVTEAVLEGLNVKTRDGKKRCSQGMYVIKVGEDFYVSGPTAFEQQYIRI